MGRKLALDSLPMGLVRNVCGLQSLDELRGDTETALVLATESDELRLRYIRSGELRELRGEDFTPSRVISNAGGSLDHPSRSLGVFVERARVRSSSFRSDLVPVGKVLDRSGLDRTRRLRLPKFLRIGLGDTILAKASDLSEFIRPWLSICKRKVVCQRQQGNFPLRCMRLQKQLLHQD